MALLGISGKIGSGKDTVGQIIQYLTSEKGKRHPDQFIEHRGKTSHDGYGYADFGQYNSTWEIKKYAGKLKQIVCLLTGCSMEDLESQEFKNKQLSEDWRKFGGEFLTDGDVVIIKNAGELYPKSIKYTINKEDKIYYEDELGKYKMYDEGKLLLIEDIVYQKGFLPTYRWMLQKVGTESMRDVIHENVWVNALFADYKTTTYRVEVPVRVAGYIDHEVSPNWIITDVRFPNEAEAVKERGGILIRLNRQLYQYQRSCLDCQTRFDCIYLSINDATCPKCNSHNHAGVKYEHSDHSSETSLDNYEGFNYVIDNNGSIEDLIESVRQVLISEKIIECKQN
jgi:hypothetical protein